MDGLAPISYTNAKFYMLDKEIENVTYWGGTADYDVNLAQPEHLAGEYRYVPSDVALNGVKVTDTASNIFVFEGQYMCEISTNFREQLPSVCKRVDGGYWYVGLYDSSGKYVGELCGNPDFLPPMWPMSDLGIESKDDTVTVHFGAYGDGGFPSKIEIAPAGSMIFWNGSRWCAAAPADTADRVTELQSEMTEALDSKADSVNSFKYLGAVSDIESVTSGSNGDTYGVKIKASPDGYYYSGVVKDLFYWTYNEFGYDDCYCSYGLKFTPPEDAIFIEEGWDDDPDVNVVQIYTSEGVWAGQNEAQSPESYPRGTIDLTTDFGVTSENDTISFFLLKADAVTGSSHPSKITVTNKVTALYTWIDGNKIKLGESED